MISAANTVKRFVRNLSRLMNPRLREAAGIIAAADAARDAGRSYEAALLYQRAIALVPGKGHLHVQAGHMFKESRKFSDAKRHYVEAERLQPLDADLQLQLGHFSKTVDRLADARAHYAQASALNPEWDEPRRELATLSRQEAKFAVRELADAQNAPIPELVPGPMETAAPPVLDRIRLRRLGARQRRTSIGMIPLLSGVEAIHGLCTCDRPLVEAKVLLDGEPIASEPVQTVPTADPGVMKAVFNLWIDLSKVPEAVYRLDVVLVDEEGWTRRCSELIAVASPTKAAGCPSAPFDSDAHVTLIAGDPRSAEQQIRSMPSVIRAAKHMLMPTPDAILVLRTDQLGDMVVSVPALVRMRALFPQARIVGLLTAANVELARSLNLFDEVLVVDFPDDAVRRKRTMTAQGQRDLAARLAPYRFDVAIDLATSDVSRQLLRIAGARLTFGFDDSASPWLDGGISGNVRDRHAPGDAASQSGRILALVERLGTLCSNGATVVPRMELVREQLGALGLDPQDRYIVLHTGARVVFSQWAGYADLARMWLDRHEGKVVMLTEGTDFAAKLPDDLKADVRLVLIDRKIAFDDLDALLTFANIFVGNDSGPKHLASLRGTPVVSIHCARISWAEWGQEQTGVIISRRVPCAGCALFHDADECGKGIACITDISVNEVFAAAEGLLGPRKNAESVSSHRPS